MQTACEERSKVSVQPHTIGKQIRFPNGNVLFLSLFSLSKNWMHNVVWGCTEILPKIHPASPEFWKPRSSPAVISRIYWKHRRVVESKAYSVILRLWYKFLSKQSILRHISLSLWAREDFMTRLERKEVKKSRLEILENLPHGRHFVYCDYWLLAL